MIEIDGKRYELKYSLKRVELIENVTGKPMMAEINQNTAMMGLTALKTYFAYGLKEEGSDIFVPTQKGIDMAEKLIEAEGYLNVTAEVLTALERDCPFFFQGA